nr:biosynthetic arginine decarboxylase-like [Nerophis lumbriciformis]
MSEKARTPTSADPWTIDDAVDLYHLDSWGRGFFSINAKGHVEVAAEIAGGAGLDLKRLVDEVIERGIEPPLLLRFSDVLKARLEEIQTAFANAIESNGYRAGYRPVYPIKVNQNRFLVEELLTAGRPFHYGLEAGSKPELIAVMALLDDPQALVICNGFKDEEYIETALLASRLGPRVILVLEKPSELPLILQAAERTGVAPRIGIRARLAARGSGHWQASGGERSKFGLGAREMVEAVELLRERGLLDRLELLHFHLGSQISSIRHLKEALREAGRVYVHLTRMGAALGYFDVGGGLGVDYDGSQSSDVSSINYSLQEYANGVIYGIQEICDAEGVEHPVVVTEAGRATVAHHAVLVLDVLDVRRPRPVEVPTELPAANQPNTELPLVRLLETYHALGPARCREAYHDALQYRDECLSLFNLGHLSLADRVLAEDIFDALCRRVWELRQSDNGELSGELVELGQQLADIYFMNFSLFQSMPDSWAIEQLFPVLPIHRLDECPSAPRSAR